METRLAPIAALCAVWLCASLSLGAQQRAVSVPRPNFAGVWTPADPAVSDTRFRLGLSPIPGRGRLTIDQRGDRVTVTITMPDEDLDPLLGINGRFYATIIYGVTDSGRSGGAGAGPVLPPSYPTWVGERLVIANPRPASRPVTTTYSFDGDRLKLETRREVAPERFSTFVEWFTRMK